MKMIKNELTFSEFREGTSGIFAASLSHQSAWLGALQKAKESLRQEMQSSRLLISQKKEAAETS